MINHISSTDTALEQNLPKTRKRIVTNLPYIPIALVLLTRIVLYIEWFVSDFIPDQQNSTNFSQAFYQVFIRRFRTRFFMDISLNSTYTMWDYIFGIYEVYLEKISGIIWVSFDTLITGIIPLTFTIMVNKFVEVQDSDKDKSVLTACQLFNNLENMSASINSIWGIICLIWAIDTSTRCAFNVKTLISSRDHINVISEFIRVVSLFLLLYFSGKVHCKVKLMIWYLSINNLYKLILLIPKTTKHSNNFRSKSSKIGYYNNKIGPNLKLTRRRMNFKEFSFNLTCVVQALVKLECSK